jgi:hypothetical protein
MLALKNSKKEKFVRICPRCNSKNVELASMKGGRYYLCKSCGFGGSLFPELPRRFADNMKRKIKIFTFKTHPFPRIILFLLGLEVIIIWALLVFR